MKSLNGSLDPRVKKLPMNEAIRLAEEIGGRVWINSKGERVFSHQLAARPCVVKGNRKESSDHLLTWLRKLYADRDTLREAFGFGGEG